MGAWRLTEWRCDITPEGWWEYRCMLVQTAQVKPLQSNKWHSRPGASLKRQGKSQPNTFSSCSIFSQQNLPWSKGPGNRQHVMGNKCDGCCTAGIQSHKEIQVTSLLSEENSSINSVRRIALTSNCSIVGKGLSYASNSLHLSFIM